MTSPPAKAKLPTARIKTRKRNIPFICVTSKPLPLPTSAETNGVASAGGPTSEEMASAASPT